MKISTHLFVWFCLLIIVFKSNGQNTDPTFTSTAITTVTDAQTYLYNIGTSDADGDVVTVTAPVLPSWLSFKPNFDVVQFVGGPNFGESNYTPFDMTIDQEGNLIVAASVGQVVYKFTPQGVRTTVVQNFGYTTGVAMDVLGNVYLPEPSTSRILKLNQQGQFEAFAGIINSAGYTDGAGVQAQFNNPDKVAVDVAGNVYVSDKGNLRIRKITPAGVVSTLAGSSTSGTGDGTGAAAQFSDPGFLVVDASNNVYVTEFAAGSIRKITSAGVVTTIVSGLASPGGIALDPNGYLYVTLRSTGNVVKYSTSGEFLGIVAGNGEPGYAVGAGTSAQFDNPGALAIDGSGNIYVADYDNGRIRQIEASSAKLTGSASGQIGNHSVELNIVDSNGGSTNQVFTISVSDGTGPVFTSPAAATAFTENGTGTVYTAVATDQSPAVVFSLAPGGHNDFFNINAGVITFKSPPDYEQYNAYSIIIIATDALANTSMQTVTIPITNLNDNAPTFTSSPIITIEDDQTYIYNIVTNDADGDGLTLTLTGALPGWLSLETGNILTGDPSGLVGSNYDVSFTVSDGVSEAIQSFNIAVTDGTGPVFTSASSTSFVENGTGVSYTAEATDLAVPIVYSLTAGGDNDLFNIDGSTGAVTFITVPDFESPVDANTDNVYSIEAIATDNLSNTSTQGVLVTVTNQNDNSPVFTSTPATTLNNDQNYSYIITTTDGDSDPTVTSVTTTLPSWLVFSSKGSATTFAGSGTAGLAEGSSGTANFSAPMDIIQDGAGNFYVSDEGNNLIRKITLSGVVSTFAGDDPNNFSGPPTVLNSPAGLALDPSGNILVADRLNHVIRIIPTNSYVATKAGTGVAGYLDGTYNVAMFDNPSDVAVDASNNVYITDRNNHRIRKIDQFGEVTTLAGSGVAGSADGQGAAAQFDNPVGITLDGSGNIYVTDMGNNKIRKITPAGLVSTLTGDFNAPNGITIDGLGNLFVTDQTHKIHKIATNGAVSEIAGSTQGFADEAGATAQFDNPGGLVVDTDGNIFVADKGNHRIRRIIKKEELSGNAKGQAGDYNVSLTASDGNGATTEQAFVISVTDVTPPIFNSAGSVSYQENGTAAAYTATAIDPSTIVFSLEAGVNDNDLFTIDGSTGEVTFISAPNAEAPTDGDGDNSYLIEITATDALTFSSKQRVVIRVTNENEFSPVFTSTPVTTVNDNQPYSYSITTTDQDFDAVTLTAEAPSWLTLSTSPFGNVSTFAGSGVPGITDGTGVLAEFVFLNGIVVDANGIIYVSDGDRIRKISRSGLVSTFAFSNSFEPVDPFNPTAEEFDMMTASQFNSGSGMVIDALGNVYMADEFGHEVKKITASGAISVFAGSVNNSGLVNGTGSAALFNIPSGLAIDATGNIYVADAGNHVIRKITPSGVVSTFAGSGVGGFAEGTGTAAQFNTPSGVAIDALGNLFVTDQLNGRIRKITASGVVSTFAGSFPGLISDGLGIEAGFGSPYGIAIDGGGVLYVTENYAGMIRKISPAGLVSTLAGSSQGYADGVGMDAQFNFAAGIAVDAAGNIFVTDKNNARVRKIEEFSQLTGIPEEGTNSVTLTASDGNGNTTDQTFTLSINDITNPVFTSLASASLVENITGTAYTIQVTDYSSSIVFSLATGGDNDLFSVDAASGIVTFNTAPDFENATDVNMDGDYVINVIATDPSTNTATLEVTITITDVDEILPVFTSLTTATFAENETGTAYTIAATDANALTYSLGTGNDEGLFNLNAGVVTFKTAPDFETKGTYTIQVNANDGLNTASQTVVIKITDVDEILPVFTSLTTATFVENETGTAYTIVATDANALTYSLGTGNDDALFNITGGAVTFVTAPDFESPLDNDADNAYVINVIATDGINSVNQNVTITVTDVDEIIPVFTSLTTATFVENGTGTAYTITATDANAITYSLGTGNDESLFNIAAGVVTFKTAPDFENPTDDNTDNAYVINVIADDGSNSVSQNVTITVTDLVIEETEGQSLITVTAIAKAKTYGEADPEFTYEITSGTLNTGDTFTGSLTRVAGENAGTYAIEQGAIALNSNYTLTFESADLTIGTKAIEITADATRKTFGDVDPALTYQISNGATLVDSDAFTGSLTRAAGEEIGTYAIEQGTLDLSSNYELIFVSSLLTITDPSATIDITITAIAKAKTYGEADSEFTYEITSGTLNTGDTFTGSLTRLAGENAGTYAIEQGTIALNSNYTLTFESADLTITKAALSVTAENKTRVYGAANPAFTLAYDGFVNEDNAAVIGTLPTLSTTATDESDVDTYAIEVSGGEALNYELELISGSLEITKAEAAITLSNLEQVTGNQVPPTVVTNPEGLSYTMLYDGAAELPTATGEYQLEVTITDKNYAGSSTGVFVITNVLSALDEPTFNLLVFPNPATEYIEINSDRAMELVRIFSTSGKLMQTSVLDGAKTARVILNGIAGGLYFIEIHDNQGGISKVKLFLK